MQHLGPLLTGVPPVTSVRRECKYTVGISSPTHSYSKHANLIQLFVCVSHIYPIFCRFFFRGSIANYGWFSQLSGEWNFVAWHRVGASDPWVQRADSLFQMDASNGYWAVQTFRPQAHTLAFFIMYGTGVASENEPRVYRTPGYVHLIYRCCQVEHSRTGLRVCHRWCLAWDCRLWSFCGYDIRGLCGGPLPNDLRLEPGRLALWNPPHMAADKHNFIVTMIHSGRRTYSGS